MSQAGPGTRGALIAAAPNAAEIAKVLCPVDRAAIICQLARTYGTLPPSLALLRRLALLEARAAGHLVCAIAHQLNLTPGRVSQLTKVAEA